MGNISGCKCLGCTLNVMQIKYIGFFFQQYSNLNWKRYKIILNEAVNEF